MSVSVSALIAQIRAELVKAETERRARREDPLLELQQVEIEVNFLVESSDVVKGGFDLKVVTFGGENQLRREDVQKVKIILGRFAGGRGPAPEGSRFRDRFGSREEVEPL